MKIIQDKNWAGREIEVTVSDAIEGTIDCAANDSGIAEMGNQKANEIGKILGKVVQALHSRHMLTDSEVADMLGWRYTIEE